MPATADLLTQLDDEGVLSRKQFDEVMGWGARSGQPYYHDRELRVSHLRTLFTKPLMGTNFEARQARIVDFMFRGTCWRAYKAEPVMLGDDADFDTRLAIEQAIKSSTRVSEMLCEYRTADKAGLCRVTEEDAEAVMAEITANMARLRNAAKAIHYLRRAQPTATP